MSESARWVGFDVSSKAVVVVQFGIPPTGPAVVEYDDTWNLQTGSRPVAYQVMYERVRHYLSDRAVDGVAIMGSSVSGHAASGGLLDGAELRGVVGAAAASATKNVISRSKGSLSRGSSRGKVDRYTKDEQYWTKAIGGKLRKGSRGVAYLVLCEGRPDAPELP